MTHAWFSSDDAFRAVFSSFVVRPKILGIMMGMDQKDSFAATQFMARFAGVDAICAVFPSVVDSSEVPQVQFWGRPWNHAACVQLSALTAEVRGRFFGALCTRHRAARGSVHRDMTPELGASRWRIWTDTYVKHTVRTNHPPLPFSSLPSPPLSPPPLPSCRISSLPKLLHDVHDHVSH